MTNTEFENAVNQYANMIYRIAFGYLKNKEDADDAVQDVLIQLYVSDKEFETQEHIRNWLIRVTINRCKKVFKAPWHNAEPLDTYADELFCEQPDYLDLYAAVMKLNKKYRIPLILFYCDGYSTREIADFLKIPEKTVSTHLRRGKEKMREYMKEDL